MKHAIKWLGIIMFILSASALSAYANIGEPWETLWLVAVGVLTGLRLSLKS